MKPAQAMGLFLRTWRQEWARLSRAQVAIAVSAACRKKTVTAKIIRKWEDSQPPQTTEEFTALLTVMGRNGLTEAEVAQFRQALLASCLDRHYPELLEDEGLGSRPDAVAFGIWETQETDPGATNLVSIVAATEDLDAVLKARLRPTSPGDPSRRQAVALAYLRGVLAKRHGLSNRYGEVVRATSANEHLIDAHFGRGGLGDHYYLSALGQRLMAEERGVGRRPNGFGRLMQLAAEAADRGYREIARHAMFSAMQCFGQEPDVSVDALRHRWETVLDEPFSLEAAADDNPWNRCHLFNACLHSGALELAAGHLEAIDSWREDTQVRGCIWHMLAGKLAVRQGRHDKAADLCHRTLRMANAGGCVRVRDTAEELLAQLEGAPSADR